MSPVSSMSGDELSHGGRRSQRRRPLLDKQVSVLKQTKYNRRIESFLKVSVDLFYVVRIQIHFFHYLGLQKTPENSLRGLF